jgi:hypothetical protein
LAAVDQEEREKKRNVGDGSIRKEAGSERRRRTGEGGTDVDRASELGHPRGNDEDGPGRPPRHHRSELIDRTLVAHEPSEKRARAAGEPSSAAAGHR